MPPRLFILYQDLLVCRGFLLVNTHKGNKRTGPVRAFLQKEFSIKASTSGLRICNKMMNNRRFVKLLLPVRFAKTDALLCNNFQLWHKNNYYAVVPSGFIHESLLIHRKGIIGFPLLATLPAYSSHWRQD